MFARRVIMQLKPNCAPEFTKRLESEVLPVLRRQKGFQDEITFVATGGKEAFGISLWDKTDSAEAYVRSSYPEVVRILEKVVDGTPRVETFEVSNSTFHKIAATATV
jgi:heme-degrading monooxygenase HmoA